VSEPLVDSSTKPTTAPLALWLLVQLLALALAAARVPLSAHFVQSGEVLAIEEMLVAQFAISATTFPFLLRDARACVAAMLTAAPMLQLAGVLAATPVARVVGAWTCVAMWLAALALWRSILPARHHAIAVAIASLLTLGGALLWYLANESQSAPLGSLSFPRALPLVATLRFTRGSAHFFLPLLSTAFLLLAGLISALGTHIVTRRRAARTT
jgi:hypothetical protein